MRLLLLLCLFSTALRAQLIGDTETGLASYYSREYDGAETAYGLTYDRNAMVAAHRAFPEGSTARVKNLDNGRSAQVKIIDKGPFIRGRIIEVSERAADRLGMLGAMTTPVEVTLVALPSDEPAVTSTPTPTRSGPPASTFTSPDGPASTSNAGTRLPRPTPAEISNARPAPNTASPPAPAPAPTPTVVLTPGLRKTANAAPPTPGGKAAAVANPSGGKSEPSRVDHGGDGNLERATDFTPGVYKVVLAKKPTGNFAVQVGSYRDLESTMDRVAALQAKWFDAVLVERVKVTGGSLYKVLLGPFQSMDAAKRYSGNLRSRYQLEGFAVELK